MSRECFGSRSFVCRSAFAVLGITSVGKGERKLQSQALASENNPRSALAHADLEQHFAKANFIAQHSQQDLRHVTGLRVVGFAAIIKLLVEGL